MIGAHAPRLPGETPRPTATETQATWATIILFLGVFWYAFGVGVSTLWNIVVG